MFENNEIEKELKGISTVLNVGLKGNIYQLPEDYFEKNPLIILSVAATSKMEVPEGYFNNLAGNIISRINSERDLSVSEELKLSSPIVANISKDNIYSVPTGYFNSLSALISEKIAPARVIKMKPFKYAIAAVITGLLGLAAFNNLFPSQNDNFLKSDTYKTAYEIINNQNFDEVLATVPADAATAYLTDYGQDVNSALAALSAEDYPLPSPNELFISDVELDNFFKC